LSTRHPRRTEEAHRAPLERWGPSPERVRGRTGRHRHYRYLRCRDREPGGTAPGRTRSGVNSQGPGRRHFSNGVARGWYWGDRPLARFVERSHFCTNTRRIRLIVGGVPVRIPALVCGILLLAACQGEQEDSTPASVASSPTQTEGTGQPAEVAMAGDRN